MRIRTKESRLSRSELWKFEFRRNLQVSWRWVAVLILPFAIWQGLDATIWQSFVVVLLAALLIATFLFSLAICTWMSISAKWHRAFYQLACFEIDDEFIEVQYADGSSIKIKIENVIQVVRTSSYYCLYYSVFHAIYLPVHGFLSDTDRESFVSLLKRHKLIRA